MHRAGRRASKMNGCEKIGSSPAPCSKNGEKKIGPLSPIRPKVSERKPGAPDCPPHGQAYFGTRRAMHKGQDGVPGFRAASGRLKRKKRRSSERRNKDWSGQRGSNPRPPPWQGGALPTEPCPRARKYYTQTPALAQHHFRKKMSVSQSRRSTAREG